eukprot:CAMPEP_0181107932 /NCGR_PEP_ID=MMETSP1071-20121207/17350_1 /TAXON_ID=35127 /ORGANISM="Thalassiosira sp., Strain NH16" /LENGTH=182 /DNA_ID=CAMNT_0023191481 /DNA_START=65 /DNA_END=613 /DNA_ORIENTATION=+
MKGLSIILAFTLFAAPTAHGFGLKSPGRNARRGGTPSSPLLDDALSSYPYVIKDEERSTLVENFNELARLYGDDEALAMVKIQPRSLKFKKDNFQIQLDSWEEQFGLEAAQGMVKRNPGLLGIGPTQLANSESSFYMSYVIAATRLSPIQLAVVGLLAFVLIGGNQDFWAAGGFYNGEMVEG